MSLTTAKNRILINFIPIKKGGGQQVALNFVKQIEEKDRANILFVATSGTFLHRLLLENGADIIAVPNSIFARLKFTIIDIHKLVVAKKIYVIFTMFGPGLHSKHAISITGSAYSNIFYPEIDFWQESNVFKKLKRYIIDYYRLKSTLKSIAIIFENKGMQDRCVKLFKYNRDNTIWIPPSISTYVRPLVGSSLLKNIRGIKVLMMTGWHNNKNITIVPEVLKCLKDMGVNDVTFVITVDWSDVRSVKLMKRAKEYGVSENIFFTGQISPVAIPDLISQVHIIALFSLLESFSNNIIESWYFEKPLIISDEEWSRAICDNAAVYVNRDDALNIAETIISLNADAQFKATIVQNGTIMLESYPSPSEKVKMQFDFIKKICDESRS